MTTAEQERLERLDARLAKVEAAIEKWESLFARFMEGPGKKIAAMLGVRVDAS